MKIDLIEQLGGYEKALQFFNNEKKSLEIDPVFYLDGQEILIDVLDDALLQYRREHNIFEVGDLIVLLHANYRKDAFSITKSFKEIYDKKGVAYRHATPEEIQAGRRLEVCGG